MINTNLDVESRIKADEIIRIGQRGVRQAQQESRDKGVPNVYSINGILHYELPDGSLTTVDPYNGKATGPAK